MSAQAIISRYNHMQRNTVSGKTLREFHDQIQSHLDGSGSGPWTTRLSTIRKNLVKVIKHTKPDELVEVHITAIDPTPPAKKKLTGPERKHEPKKDPATIKKTGDIPTMRKELLDKKAKSGVTFKDLKGVDLDMLHGLELIQDDKDLQGKQLGTIGDTTYKVITDKILSLIEKDGLIWRKPWNQKHQGKESHAHNYVTKTFYRGGNFYLNYLLLSDYTSPYYFTFKQVDQLGGSVKKNQKGWPVIYFKWLYKKNGNGLVEESEAMAGKRLKRGYSKFPALFYYTVFNYEQCDGIKVKQYKQVTLSAKEKIETCERIVDSMPQRPPIHKVRGDRAYYLPVQDEITMPLLEQFDIDQEYYSTLFHELVHSTGHSTRLSRDLTGRFGSKKYAFEELIAELGASYLCGESGVLYFTMNNTAAYLKSWSKKLKEEMQNDNKFFLRSAAAAEKASEFILGRAKAKKKEKEAEVVEVPEPVLNGQKIKVVKAPKLAVESKKSLPPVKTKERGKAAAVPSKKSKSIKGIVDASALAGIDFREIPLNEEYKQKFVTLNSDSNVMVWGKPGSGKTVELLKFAQYLAEQDLRVLYISEEEFGKSTLAGKIKSFNIGHKNLSFTGDLDEKQLANFDAIFFDSINSMGLISKEVKQLDKDYPNKLFVLIVQTTKEGDFRGGKDWEHLVDIAGEVVNRQLILRKNRLDPNNGEKYDKFMFDERVKQKKEARELNDRVNAETVKEVPNTITI